MDFTDFYLTYYPQLVQTAKRYLGAEDAEDTVQDVLTVLWEKKDALSFVENLPAYAFSAVKNKCIDLVKHRQYKYEYCRKTLSSMQMELKLEMLSNGSSIIKDIEGKGMENRISIAINTLPNRCRTIFLMSREDGMKYQEISDVLGISMNTVECQMTIALKKLRMKLHVS